METTIEAPGMAEEGGERHLIVTETTLEIDKDLLPTRGRFRNARYCISTTIQSTTEGDSVGGNNGELFSVHTLHGQYNEAKQSDFLRLYPDMHSEPCGRVSLEPFDLSWTPDDMLADLSDECFVRLRIHYDPGRTFHRLPRCRETFKQEDPDINCITAFEDIDVAVDYRGRIEGSDTEQRLSMSIGAVLPTDDGLIVQLIKESDGVEHPTIECDPAQNLMHFDRTGEHRWTVSPVENSDGDQLHHRRLWRYDDKLLTEAGGQGSGYSPYIEIDPETGKCIDIITKYPELEDD